MWKVRAEIVGDFVEVWEFPTETEARMMENQLLIDGIWDHVDCWKVDA